MFPQAGRRHDSVVPPHFSGYLLGVADEMSCLRDLDAQDMIPSQARAPRPHVFPK